MGEGNGKSRREGREGGREGRTADVPSGGAGEAAAAEEGGEGQPDHHHIDVVGRAWGGRGGKEGGREEVNGQEK